MRRPRRQRPRRRRRPRSPVRQLLYKYQMTSLANIQSTTFRDTTTPPPLGRSADLAHSERKRANALLKPTVTWARDCRVNLERVMQQCEKEPRRQSIGSKERACE